MSRTRLTAGLAPALLAASLGSAAAQATPVAPPPTSALTQAEAEAAEQSADEVIILESTAPAESASSIHFAQTELRRRPHNTPSDLLRQIPGLVVSQHAGGGKSDQYFLRGFDADHGTDVAVFVDDIPVNLTSHGHGQGYADTHWLIPETVASVDMSKGPYAARFGDFYTAGALQMRTIDEVPEGTGALQTTVGSELAGPVAAKHLASRLVGMASPQLGPGRLLVAGEVGYADGPFINPQEFRRGTALAKWRGQVGPGELRLGGTFYTADWNQSGQVPSRLVASGALDRFGSVDPSEGGSSSRYSASGGYTVGQPARGQWAVHGYALKYQLDLYSNFTLYARDPVNGDEINQTDDRGMYGGQATYQRLHRAGKVAGLVTAGLQVRYDDTTASLWHAAKRVRLPSCFGENLNPCNRADNQILDLAAYVEDDVSIGSRLRLLAGLRFDQYLWRVEDLDPETAMTAATLGGEARKSIVSPKLSAIIRVSDGVEAFVNGGLGFHSNDARAAVASDGEGALARAVGAETGVRVAPQAGLHASLDVWYLHLASEQVWSGDAGGTEASDPTRRYGIDVDLSWDAASWLTFDANLAVGRSTFVANAGNGGALALAPRIMGGAGVAVHRGADFVSLRTRGIGDRPANDDGSLTAEGFVLVDVVAAKQLGKRLKLGLTINNLLNVDWREAQFAEESRVSPTADLVEDVHFTPGMPLTALATVGYTL